MTPTPTWITVCDTCKRDDWDESRSSITDGEALAALVETEVAGDPNLRVRRVSCLMGCNRSCNVALQNPGKLSYTLGEFTPDSDAAAAIVDYARKHAASTSGQVPYRDWPQGVKGHFVTRHPPLPSDEA
jgi:predicted metal-binding protein